MDEPEFDVVISGYGPTGLTAAALLSRLGHRVCVFERWPSLYGQPRIATIDAESARIIQAACDVDQAFRNSLPRRQYLFANGDGHVLIDHQWDRTHDCGFPYRISLHQPDVEDALDIASRARGAEINQGWEVVAVDQDDRRAVVTARERIAVDGGSERRGRERTVAARYVIGADGARSVIREALRIERESWPYRNAWYSVDAVRKRRLPNFWGLSPDGQVAVIFCLPEGRAHSIIPLGRNHMRFNFEVDPDGRHHDKLNTEVAYRYLEGVYGVGPEDVEVYRQAIYPFEGRLAKSWREGRVFLAGDAAHLMTPFLGQGGCAGFRDAINLAWKFDLVLKGLADETLLDTYEAERLPHVRIHVDGSDKAAAIAFKADPVEAAERDRVLMSGNALPTSPDPVLTSGILQRSAIGRVNPPVGGLAPQGQVRVGETEGRFDDVVGWGVHLVAWDCNPNQALNAGQPDFLERIGGLAVGVSDRGGGELAQDMSGIYRHYFETYGIKAFLMRPDFVVFGVARTVEQLPQLVDDFRSQLGVPMG